MNTDWCILLLKAGANPRLLQYTEPSKDTVLVAMAGCSVHIAPYQAFPRGSPVFEVFTTTRGIKNEAYNTVEEAVDAALKMLGTILDLETKKIEEAKAFLPARKV
jgi:hypothetical protein